MAPPVDTSVKVVTKSISGAPTLNGTDTAPINPVTGVPYFTISALGWGAGWAAGVDYNFELPKD